MFRNLKIAYSSKETPWKNWNNDRDDEEGRGSVDQPSDGNQEDPRKWIIKKLQSVRRGSIII